MIFLDMFRRRWLLTTFLVFLGCAICIRLGIWQLDRLEQRRAFNAQVTSMQAEPVLDLNIEEPQNISGMEWRAATATGEYDFANQVALRNQYYGATYGYHLVTPLLLADRVSVLVDRGWIPAEGNASPEDWRKYDESGVVQVTGQIRLGSGKPSFGGIADPELSPGQTRLDAWNNFDVERIAKQIPYPILSVYLQSNADASDETPPIPFQPEMDLTEGSHFGYALQWFTFATILFIGYPFYLRNQQTGNTG